jgi:hypothetical protein
VSARRTAEPNYIGVILPLAAMALMIFMMVS